MLSDTEEPNCFYYWVLQKNGHPKHSNLLFLAGVNKCLYSPAKAGEQLRILGLLGKSFGWCEAPPETLP